MSGSIDTDADPDPLADADLETEGTGRDRLTTDAAVMQALREFGEVAEPGGDGAPKGEVVWCTLEILEAEDDDRDSEDVRRALSVLENRGICYAVDDRYKITSPEDYEADSDGVVGR